LGKNGERLLGVVDGILVVDASVVCSVLTVLVVASVVCSVLTVLVVASVGEVVDPFEDL